MKIEIQDKAQLDIHNMEKKILNTEHKSKYST
jgi:hypothetical protein